jgi:hypothetical protein
MDLNAYNEIDIARCIEEMNDTDFDSIVGWSS